MARATSGFLRDLMQCIVPKNARRKLLLGIFLIFTTSLRHLGLVCLFNDDFEDGEHKHG